MWGGGGGCGIDLTREKTAWRIGTWVAAAVPYVILGGSRALAMPLLRPLWFKLRWIGRRWSWPRELRDVSIFVNRQVIHADFGDSGVQYSLIVTEIAQYHHDGLILVECPQRWVAAPFFNPRRQVDVAGAERVLLHSIKAFKEETGKLPVGGDELSGPGQPLAGVGMRF